MILPDANAPRPSTCRRIFTEHDATVFSFDRDFTCFDGLQWTLPADD